VDRINSDRLAKV